MVRQEILVLQYIMTDLEQFNLYWLCHAMTAPPNCVEAYYYDAGTKRFFYSKPVLSDPGKVELFDMIDLALPANLAADLVVRLGAIDSVGSEIVEIPRLNVQDKVSIQLLFLSNFTGIIHEEELRLDVEQQPDVYGFVLDVLLANNKVLAPALPYWDNFKLKTIQYYLEKFTGLVGITSKLL